MLQYKIPQNVGIEDKIVGPLTLKQLIILSVGAGTSYVLFAILSKIYELNILEYIIIALPFLTAAAAALIKVNDITFPKFILLFAEFGIKPKKRAWNHQGIVSLVAPDLTEAKAESKSDGKADPATAKKNVNLRDLSRVLDSAGFNHVKMKTPEDIDKAADEDLVTQAFFGNKKNETDNMYWRTNKHDRGKRLNLLAKLPTVTPKKPQPAVAIADRPKEPVVAPVSPKAVPASPTLVTAMTATPIKIAPAPARPSPTITAATAIPQEPLTTPVKSPQNGGSAPAAAPAVRFPESTPAPKAGSPVPTEISPVKKKRRRKKKTTASAVRPDTHVNTVDKKQPVQFPPKPANALPQKPPRTALPFTPAPEKTPPPLPARSAEAPKTPSARSGEFKFETLQKGEIEINLD